MGLGIVRAQQSLAENSRKLGNTQLDGLKKLEDSNGAQAASRNSSVNARTERKDKQNYEARKFDNDLQALRDKVEIKQENLKSYQHFAEVAIKLFDD